MWTLITERILLVKQKSALFLPLSCFADPHHPTADTFWYTVDDRLTFQARMDLLALPFVDANDDYSLPVHYLILPSSETTLNLTMKVHCLVFLTTLGSVSAGIPAGLTPQVSVRYDLSVVDLDYSFVVDSFLFIAD